MRGRWVSLVAALALALLVGGAIGYVLRDHRATATVVTGSFYAGDRQATTRVDGWSYAITDGVAWQDQQGSWHDRGWPDCLAPIGSTHTLRFAYVPVTGLPVEWRQVVWVSCQA